MSLSDDASYSPYNYASRLSSENLSVYSNLYSYIAQIASGSRTNTSITVSNSAIRYEYTAVDLGVVDIGNDYQVRTAVDNILKNMVKSRMKKEQSNLWSMK